jgi:hypothetical protein
VLTTKNTAGINSIACLPKHGGTQDKKLLSLIYGDGIKVDYLDNFNYLLFTLYSFEDRGPEAQK